MYVPLYIKTNYSLLSSLVKIPALIEYAKKHGITQLAIVDDYMFGYMEFYHACCNSSIKPIFGLSIKLTFNEKENELVVYAKNYQGYLALAKLSTKKSREEIKLEDVISYQENLIVIVPYVNHEFYQEIESNFSECYLGYFGKEEEFIASSITKNIVFIHPVFYLESTEAKYLNYLFMIREGTTLADGVLYDQKNHNLCLAPLSYSSPVGLTKSIEIANSCQVEFPKPELMLPIYKAENQMPVKDYLDYLTKKGLNKRLQGNVPKVYQDRLEYELKIINQMGFANYFLVVYDFIRYAKKNKILVGPGRGSAAGSLVSYTLGITDIDPIHYNLLFERFLNPERVTMPDIDTDFPDQYRDQVIRYVIDKYGEKKVAGIITFGTLGSKQAIRDVSRVMNIPLYKVDQLCNLLPVVSKQTLKDFYQNIPKFKLLIDQDDQVLQMFKIACYLEGFPRHTSIHAAGIVMCEKNLDEVIPLYHNDEMYLSAYSMEYLEEFGLLKMDFLGLKNLTTIMNILEDIEETTGIRIDFNQIPYNDTATLKIFEEAKTSGIFQFESSGMRNFLRKLKPNRFEDLFAAIALFRPGPAVNIDTYVKRRHHLEEVSYIVSSLEPILENTYGILIYQEQIMQVAQIMAGYTLGEADILRRAMSKKKKEVLSAEEDKFIRQSISRGYQKEKAKEVFDLILNFANYGFNRAHSVAYSIIAYKMAYLKVHYQTFFYSNLLSSVIGSEKKLKEYMYEAKDLKIKFLKPNIRMSTNRFLASQNTILFPLSAIRNVGVISCREIIKIRNSEPFSDLYDCMSKLVRVGISKKTVESLILASALDCYSYTKKALITQLDTLLNYAELTLDLDPSLVMKPELVVMDEYDDGYLLEQEKQLFGFYLSSHPVSNYRLKYKDAVPLELMKDYLNRTFTCLMMVENIKRLETKNKEQMAFVFGSDDTTTADFTIFPRVLQRYPEIKKGDLYLVKGTVERRYDRYQVIIQQLKSLKEEEEKST